MFESWQHRSPNVTKTTYFAIAELDVIDSDGANISRGQKVSALDSIEAPVRWRKTNLTDGIFATAADPEAATQLQAAQQERQKLLDQINTPQRVAKRKQLTARQGEVQKSLNALPVGKMVYAAATSFKPQGNFKPTGGKPRPVRLLHRGNVQQPTGDVIPGTVPLSAESNWQFALPNDHTEGDRRAALAKWVVADENPLTWRSMANRIWQYHFGQGLVASPNDFGRMGQQPTHPDLLDWLADELRRTQSVKHLHRLIVNSATYRQRSSRADADASQAIDSGNQFLWRMNRRKLSAEEIRDSILSVSGRLNLEMGGLWVLSV